MKFHSQLIGRLWRAQSRQRLPELGERELAVLEVLWQSGQSSAQAVQTALPGPQISLSTVQSTLERLHRKQLLRREKQGRAYLYRAQLNRSQLIAELLHDMADDVAGGDVAPMLSGFLDYVAAQAPEVRRQVSDAIEQRSEDDDA
jgi:predicted transcriptional regulator